jgi:cytosine permease
MPKAKTWKITLIVGSITTLAACFPALVMQLLDFVALYGLVLMPMGAIIFIDYWLFPRIGLQSNLAVVKNLTFNIAALVTWLGSLLACYLIAKTTGLEIFFLGLPGWFLAALIYIISSYAYQKKWSK